MRRVYLSFLGLGQFNKETEEYSYKKTVYALKNKLASETCFVQVAEQELLGWDYFDHLFIAATDESYKWHGKALQEQLAKCRGDVHIITLDENMTAAGQWKWFEEIFTIIKEGDILTVDLTHGYRSIPIIFSTAINFLQKTKHVQLVHVFYGAYEKDTQKAPLVDMRSFYDINTWADAVGRLTEDADASGIATAAGATNRLQFEILADEKFGEACENVTRVIKNVDVNNVSDATNDLMQITEQIKSSGDTGTRQLMNMLEQKLRHLASSGSGNPDRDGYTLEYFRIQLELAGLLLEHGLLMQAFTVMREWLGSLVMLHFENEESMNTRKRRKKRKRYGDIFFNMLQYREETWDFGGQKERFDRILPFYNRLKTQNIISPLLEGEIPPASQLSRLRNRLDHAWLGEAGMKAEIENNGLLEDQGMQFLKCLKTIMNNLESAPI